MNNNNNNEILTLQFGKKSNWIATHYWNLHVILLLFIKIY